MRALAAALDRNYRRVRDDVEALAEAGLLEQAGEGTGVTAFFDAIEARIALLAKVDRRRKSVPKALTQGRSPRREAKGMQIHP